MASVLDLSFLDYEDNTLGLGGLFGGRQMSEPASVGARTWSPLNDEPLKVTQRKRTVKKTTFDLDDNDQLPDNLAVSRQMSEPVKVYMSCGINPTSKSNKIKKKGEDISSGSDAESQATTSGSSPSVISSCSTPGGAFSTQTTSASGSPQLDLPPGLELPPGLQNLGCEVVERPREDSDLPQKVSTSSFGKSSLSASAPEFTPGKEDQFAESARTTNTVTVTSLPTAYSRETLIEELKDSGFTDGRDYDYLCVPMTASGTNKGVCFINFLTPGLRHAFVAAYQGREMRQGVGRPVSVKPCTLSDVKSQITPETEPRRAKFCPQCGGSITASFRFCTQCGSSLKHLP
jgi:hypothetical protein